MKRSSQRSFSRWLLSRLLAPPPTIKKRRRGVQPVSPPPNSKTLDRPIIPDEVSIRLAPDPPPLNFHAVDGNPLSEPSSQPPTSVNLKVIAANDDMRGEKCLVIGSVKAEVSSGYWGYSAWGQTPKFQNKRPVPAARAEVPAHSDPGRARQVVTMWD